MTDSKTCNVEYIDLPRFADLDPEGKALSDIAVELHNRAIQYCRSHIPDYEWISNPLEIVGPEDAYQSLSKHPDGLETIGMLVSSTRGRSEGYVCNAYLARSLEKGGMTIVSVMCGKFWTREDAEKLARQIQEWYCW